MAKRDETTSEQAGAQRDGPPGPINKATLEEWHRALAQASGLLSGALAKRSVTPRLLNAVASMVRPVLRDMERNELLLEVRETMANEQAQLPRVKSTRKS